VRLDSILIFPGCDVTNLVTHSGVETLPIREARGFDDFANELIDQGAASVRVEDQPELPAPMEDVIFVCRPDVLQRSLAQQPDRAHLLSSRTVLVDIVRTYALEWAERLALCAVIESGQYFRWQEERQNPTFVYGLKDVAKAFGATWPDLPQFQGTTYAPLTHDGFPSLPALLAAYLKAYVRLL
jgi:hypothetical protein